MSVSVLSHPLYRCCKTHSIYDITSTVYMAKVCTVYDNSPTISNITTLYSWHQIYYISPHTDYIWQHIHCISVITPRLSIIQPQQYIWIHCHNMYDMIWTTYHLFCMMWIAGWLRSQCKGNWPHLNLILGTPNNFAFLGWHQCSFRIVTVLLGTLWHSIKQFEAPYVFDWEKSIALDTMQGNRASSRGEVKVSWVFSSWGRHLVYILELRRGCPF